MPKRLRPADICLPDRKRPKTMEIQNFFYNLPDDIIDHIFSFIKRPRLNMNYSENALKKVYKDY